MVTRGLGRSRRDPVQRRLILVRYDSGGRTTVKHPFLLLKLEKRTGVGGKGITCCCLQYITLSLNYPGCRMAPSNSLFLALTLITSANYCPTPGFCVSTAGPSGQPLLGRFVGGVPPATVTVVVSCVWTRPRGGTLRAGGAGVEGRQTARGRGGSGRRRRRCRT